MSVAPLKCCDDRVPTARVPSESLTTIEPSAASKRTATRSQELPFLVYKVLVTVLKAKSPSAPSVIVSWLADEPRNLLPAIVPPGVEPSPTNSLLLSVVKPSSP